MGVDVDWLLQPNTLAFIMLANAIAAFLALIFGPTAPYGRYVAVATTTWSRWRWCTRKPISP